MRDFSIRYRAVEELEALFATLYIEKDTSKEGSSLHHLTPKTQRMKPRVPPTPSQPVRHQSKSGPFLKPINPIESNTEEGVSKYFHFVPHATRSGTTALVQHSSTSDWETADTIHEQIKNGLKYIASEYDPTYRFVQTYDDALCAFMTACQVLYSVCYHDMNEWGKTMLNALRVGQTEPKPPEATCTNVLAEKPEIMTFYQKIYLHHAEDPFVPMNCPAIFKALFDATHDTQSLGFLIERPDADEDVVRLDKSDLTLQLVDVVETERITISGSLGLLQCEINSDLKNLKALAENPPLPFNVRGFEGEKGHLASIVQLQNKQDAYGEQWNHYISCMKVNGNTWTWFDPSPAFSDRIDEKYLGNFEKIISISYLFKLN